ncbi:DUF1853 family protein [Endozoicomonas sp.]|uniref:DUF1853 family protein n=1 Tax=Endozoicomonas sp. TaxID=1892382 RepID=UPI0028836825|nr:DUF1853 family protein [Endozoicomonas sp.]
MNGFLHQNTRHTLHQALQWVQSSPPLFNQMASPLCLNQALPVGTVPLLPDSEQLDLLASLVKTKGNPLLGIFYETIWQFLLNQLPDSHVIASNLQVRGEKNGQFATLGEYDLLYQFRKQFFHRELAVKFYLGIPYVNNVSGDSPWRHWVGPGLKDRLDRKMDRLLNHQITLGDTEQGLKALSGLGIGPVVEKEVLIQGRLFYPLYPLKTAESPAIHLTDLFQSQTDNTQWCQPPELSNPDHLRGYWLTQNQFLLSTEPVAGDLSYQTPDKIQWLNRHPASGYLNQHQLMYQLKQQQRPVYVRAIHQELQGQMHLFIVPDDWPIQAEAAVYQKIELD